MTTTTYKIEKPLAHGDWDHRGSAARAAHLLDIWCDDAGVHSPLEFLRLHNLWEHAEVSTGGERVVFVSQADDKGRTRVTVDIEADAEVGDHGLWRDLSRVTRVAIEVDDA